jgi:hypothetical protein
VCFGARYTNDTEAVILSMETKWRVEARLIFEKADKDGSGAIEFDEFLMAAACMPVLSLGFALFQHLLPSTDGTPDGTLTAAPSHKQAKASVLPTGYACMHPAPNPSPLACTHRRKPRHSHLGCCGPVSQAGAQAI